MNDDLFEGWLAMPAISDFLNNTTAELKNVGSYTPNQEGSQSICTDKDILLARRKSADQSSGSTSPITDETSRQRRCHTKSRLGCLLCKKRKIKCQETWPACANCTKRGAACQYPTIFRAAYERRVARIPGPRQIIKLSDSPTNFNMDDMRLFHYYLISAYPSIPHEYEDIWVKDIPTLSHHTSYLMEAILALAGSHIAPFTEEPDTKRALVRRQRAIRGLEESFSRWPPKAEEAHVMLAVSYLLTFQSSHLEDGFLEHIVSLRGCAMLSQLILQEALPGPFAVQVNMQTVSLAYQLQNFPRLDRDLISEALYSVRDFRHLVYGTEPGSVERAICLQFVLTLQPLLEPDSDEDLSSKIEPGTPPPSLEKYGTKFTTPYGQLFVQNPLLPVDLDDGLDKIDWQNIAKSVSPGPDALSSFNALMTTLLIMANCDFNDLTRLFDTTNQLSNVIMAHFLAIRFVVSPLGAFRSAVRSPVHGFIKWTERIMDAVQDEPGEGVKWTEHVKWPRKILTCMQECLKIKRGWTFKDIYDLVVEDPGAFKEGRARKWDC